MMKCFLRSFAFVFVAFPLQVMAQLVDLDCNGTTCVSMEQEKTDGIITYFGQRLILDDDKVCTWSVRVRIGDGVVLDRRTNCARIGR